ncbi:2465_t:CDS:10 [Ambispora leptoticha]|uniref:2465_t:CDS:1 n=1 Tax=Ambispora leptoticha TaxID=144679 RepID=A0A9N9C7P8_9GLOM|nr:2465_t:CDS:10 [Ambispora leptoticha]
MSKPRPAVPPKPARLSINNSRKSEQNHDSLTNTRELELPICDSPKTESPVCSSPKTPTNEEETIAINTNKSNDEHLVSPTLSGRQARALYDFEGIPSYRELSFRAGDVLTILKQQLAEGWSLGQKDGITGLIPEAYITYINDFTELPNATVENTSYQLSSSNNSPLPTPITMPATPLTGTYNSLLRGRQLNRFSWFVTLGAEEFILNGGGGGLNEIDVTSRLQGVNENEEEENDEITESDKHYIQSGPSWREKTPPFKVMVHSPERRVKLGGMQEYTVFHVTSMFSEGAQVTVERRFSQFEWLHDRLSVKFGPLVIPPLPEKQYSGRFNGEFIEKRRRALESFINRLARHPVLRYSDLLTHFLSCEDDSEWRKREKLFDSDKITGQAFFKHVYHPEFNIDEGDIEAFERFQAFTRGMEKLMPYVNEASTAHKDSMNESQRQYRRIGFDLLRLVTGHNVGDGNECINEEGAWCWRDGCQSCQNLTKAIQATAESMQTIADLYDLYTKDECITLIENFKEYSYPVSNYEALVDTHMGTYKKFKEVAITENDEASKTENPDSEEIRSRCETVFNVTLAEVDRIHDERVTDFKDITKKFLDGQIELYEKILEELRQARSNFDDPHYSSLSQTPISSSRYEALIDEQRPILSRPVSVASVGSMSSVVGGVVDGVGSMGSFLLKKTARTSLGRVTSTSSSMFDIWWGRS